MSANLQVPVPQRVRAGIMGTLWFLTYLTVALAAVWLFTYRHAPAGKPLVYEAGRLCALVAFPVLILQLVIAARFRPPSRPFGLDMVFRFHKAAAVIAAVLLILHPTLMALQLGNWNLFTSIDAPWYLWFGRIALVVVLINATLSMWRHYLGIDFQIWRSMHNMFAQIIVGFAFAHSWTIGQDIQDPVAAYLWIALLTLGAAAYLHHKVIRPFVLGRRPWTVTKVKQENKDVWTLTFAPPKASKRFEFVPGQFHFVTLLRRANTPDEEHHWTIAQSPTRENLSSSIKASGDYTATIGQTKVGTKAKILGPYGRFSYALYPRENDLVFIAGGIGITPIMSMLRHMHDIRLPRNVKLIWANKTPRDLLFTEELRRIQLSNAPQLDIYHFFSRQEPVAPVEGAEIAFGRLSIQILSQILTTSDRSGAAFYICCPPELAKATIRWLNQMGVPASRIHWERFFL